jgi:hypothetical protein
MPSLGPMIFDPADYHCQNEYLYLVPRFSHRGSIWRCGLATKYQPCKRKKIIGSEFCQNQTVFLLLKTLYDRQQQDPNHLVSDIFIECTGTNVPLSRGPYSQCVCDRPPALWQSADLHLKSRCQQDSKSSALTLSICNVKLQ